MAHHVPRWYMMAQQLLHGATSPYGATRIMDGIIGIKSGARTLSFEQQHHHGETGTSMVQQQALWHNSGHDGTRVVP